MPPRYTKDEGGTSGRVEFEDLGVARRCLVAANIHLFFLLSHGYSLSFFLSRRLHRRCHRGGYEGVGCAHQGVEAGEEEQGVEVVRHCEAE